MSAFSPDDFGDTTALLRALGLIKEDGNFNGSWVENPKEYLSKMIADDGQRAALLEFVAAVRNGQTERDSENRLWIELFSETIEGGSSVSFFIVVDDAPADEVHLFVGVRFATGAPLTQSRSSLMFPLFRAPKIGTLHPPSLFGQSGGYVVLSSEITIANAPAAPGQPGLQGVGLRISIPTAGSDGDPQVGLMLSGLQLPGELSPRDLNLSLSDPDALRDAGFELIIGLIQAQVGTDAEVQIRAFARLFGLANDPEIPNFPIEEIFTRGVDALGDWLGDALGTSSKRTAWMQALADLLGQQAILDNDDIVLTVGSTDLRLGMRAITGVSGSPVVTISAAFGLVNGPVEAAIRAEVMRIDLGTGTAVAVPSLRAEVRVDLSGLVMPDVSVETLVVGFGLNEARQPVLVIEVLNAVLFSTTHPRLDLTNPDALAATAAGLVTDALSDLLGDLGPAGDLIAVALGWAEPTGAAPGYPSIDLLEFLGDPIGQLRTHWLNVLNNHAGDVTKVLAELRILISGDTTPDVVTGDGTDASPWSLPLLAGLQVLVWRDASGKLLIGLGFVKQVDTLGQRCTVVETRVRAAFVAIDLDTGGVGFLPEISVRAFGRARGGGPLFMDHGGLRIEMDHLGLEALWFAETGLHIGHSAPNLKVFIDQINEPIDIPDFSGSFDDILERFEKEDWDTIERLVSFLARQVDVDVLNDLVDALGWRRRVPVLGGPQRHRLRLAGLIDDAESELRNWLARLLADGYHNVAEQVQPLARFLSGRSDVRVHVEGEGTIRNPWHISLNAGAGIPAIAIWRQPEAPLPIPDALDSQPLRQWSPDEEGLDAGKLANAIFSEFPDIAGSFNAGLDRDGLVDGLSDLIDYWSGSDGLVRPPEMAIPVPGATIHLIENQSASVMADGFDLEQILGAAPATQVNIRVLPASATIDAALDPLRVLDMREAGRDPLAFTPLPNQVGTWHILLAPRSDAALASGDPDGIRGQVARLTHGLSLIRARAETTVIADASAGHASWLALQEMGSGLDSLVTLGLPVTPTQVPETLSPVAAEMLRRVAEFLPEVDPGEPDDADLARIRDLLESNLSRAFDAVTEVALPAGWTGDLRADLDSHLVYGVFDENAIQRALTAAVAAGLSLHAQVRDVARELQSIESASLGVWLPLSTAPSVSGLQSRGHILAEIIGVDIDATIANPAIEPRAAHAFAAALELFHSDGWLIGGPSSAATPLDLELRTLEIDVQLTLGTSPDPVRNSCRVILHGVRIHDRRYPRLVLSPDLLPDDLGIEGLAPPTQAEIQQLLNGVLSELAESTDDALSWIADTFRAAGILSEDDNFDAISLSNWLDNPAARLRDMLVSPATQSQVMALIETMVGAQSGLTFDAASGQLGIDLSATTGLPLFDEWSISAQVGPSGVSAASLRLGAISGTHISVDFINFSAQLNLGDGDAQFLGGLPTTVSLWPAPNFLRLGEAILPALIATSLSRILDGLREFDSDVRPVIDGALTALGLLQPGGVIGRVIIPPLMFIDPAAWLRQQGTLGTLDGGTIRADRVIALMDALKPLVGLAGDSGVWEIAPGLALRARSDSGFVLEFMLDPAEFMPAADVDFGGSVGLRIGTDGRVLPAIGLFVGISGGTAGNQAVHLTVAGSDVVLFLRNDAGVDFEIFPNTGSLTQILAAGISAALPMALNAIVDTDSDAGHLLADIGDALLLRPGGDFSGPELTAWASDPVAQLETRWLALLGAGLGRLDNLLPNGISLVSTPSSLKLEVTNAGTVGSVVFIEFNNSPIWVELACTITDVPFINEIDVTLRFDDTGIAALSTQIGPAEIPLTDDINLRPIFALEIGNSVTDPFVSIGLATNTDPFQKLTLEYQFNTQYFDLGFGDNSPTAIASGIMVFAVDLLGSFLLTLPEINTVLDEQVGGSSIRGLLSGVVLTPTGTGLDGELFRVALLDGESTADLLDNKLARVLQLLQNIVASGPSITIDGAITIGLDEIDGRIGFNAALTDRMAIVDGDIAIWIENDSRWILGEQSDGLFIGLLKFDAGDWDFDPSLSVNGLGIRIGRSNAPLLESPLSLGSIALHIYANFSNTEKLGGVQVQLSDIGVAVGAGGESGSNAVAGSILAETNEGDATLAPAFSPAISVQTKPGGGVAFGFSAGDGEGPWWLPIRSQFGPLYIDQVGLGTQVNEDGELQSLSLLFDGNISIAGLQAAVDDLELRYTPGDAGIFAASSWAVDLAGLAVSADMSGVTLAGGMRKFGSGDNLEYVGMLSARFATYGLSIYGGYASVQTPEPYSAFFAFGAVLGPFGGPPAFFLTGIGGGFGINRDIVPPTDMSRFDEFVMISALDPSFDPPGDLMAYMAEVRNTFPAKKGKFWFAAGISFTSFALVDGVAVVAVEFGQGFELSIFGLARMALPRPEVALVSIELGLMARFSTEEGVIWVQAQLTDNSWLLHQTARLTGGFAYVSWFKGDKAGQFVLTLGGYHPNFRRDGYPVVPRLGFNWSVSSHIVVKAEVYFALTSEAIMAGGLFEASATFGPAFAYLSFGGNAIVYFDPFRYEADAHARVSAGIRIKTFLGTIKLSFTLGAEIKVAGPEFHGTARIEVGPIDISVSFGDATAPNRLYLSWPDFAAKYLELAPGNQAQALSSIAGRGALPPSGTDSEEAGTADGSAAHPFDVMSEFDLAVTSTIPLTGIFREGAIVVISLEPTLGLAPMGEDLPGSVMRLELRRNDKPNIKRLNEFAKIKVMARETGNFPVGVWGVAQSDDDKKVPKGDVIPATEGADLQFRPSFSPVVPDLGTGGVAANQIEPGDRKPLPLRSAGSIRRRLVREAKVQRRILKLLDPKLMPIYATGWQREDRSATARRAWVRERAVPMRIGLLSERIVGSTRPGRKKVVKPGLDIRIRDPKFDKVRLRGIMYQPTRAAPEDVYELGTRVTDATRAAKGLRRIAPPLINAATHKSAVLLRAQVQSSMVGKTLVANGSIPETMASFAPISTTAGRVNATELSRMSSVETMLMAPASNTRRRGRGPDNSETKGALNVGEIAVFDLPGAKNAAQFVSSGDLSISGNTRLAVIGLNGRVTMNTVGAKNVKLPARSSGFVLMAGEGSQVHEISGWLETTQVAYLGRGLARVRGGFVRAEGASRARGGRNKGGVGWMPARDLTDQSAVVTTQFDSGAHCVAIVFEGTATDKDLSEFSVSFDGVTPTIGRPLLVPFDGKTLIIYRLRSRDHEIAFSVTLAGQVDDRLDGVIAARMTSETLVSRLVNGAVRLDLESLSAGKNARSGSGKGGVSAHWKPPARKRKD